MRKVFISHPYASDPTGNKKRVEGICKSLAEQGKVLPISPLHLFGFMANDDLREPIMEACCRLVDFCDEVWIYGDSEGCRKEEEYALATGKKVVQKWEEEWEGRQS